MTDKQLEKENQIICTTCGFVGQDHDDIYDCVEYHEEKNGVRKGQWLIDWSRRLKEKEKTHPRKKC